MGVHSVAYVRLRIYRRSSERHDKNRLARKSTESGVFCAFTAAHVMCFVNQGDIEVHRQKRIRRSSGQNLSFFLRDCTSVDVGIVMSFAKMGESLRRSSSVWDNNQKDRAALAYRVGANHNLEAIVKWGLMVWTIGVKKHFGVFLLFPWDFKNINETTHEEAPYLGYPLS